MTCALLLTRVHAGALELLGIISMLLQSLGNAG